MTLPYVCDQCGQGCSRTYSVTRHRSLLPPSKVHALKSWYPVNVCPSCVGPAVTEDEKRSPVAYQVRREKAS